HLASRIRALVSTIGGNKGKSSSDYNTGNLYDTSEGKAVIPSSLVTAENYLTISEEGLSLSSVEELTRAVEQCKEMVLESAECSEDFRLRLQEAREALREEERNLLDRNLLPRPKHHCDRCCGVIWSVVHSMYLCYFVVYCKYSCHVKCLDKVCRVCAHVKVSENPSYISDICPEMGLSVQAYRCAECKAHITF
ncbi:hypothetical protein L9F63_026393, partial [Diploptera punctata]